MILREKLGRERMKRTYEQRRIKRNADVTMRIIGGGVRRCGDCGDDCDDKERWKVLCWRCVEDMERGMRVR